MPLLHNKRSFCAIILNNQAVELVKENLSKNDPINNEVTTRGRIKFPPEILAVQYLISPSIGPRREKKKRIFPVWFSIIMAKNRDCRHWAVKTSCGLAGRESRKLIKTSKVSGERQRRRTWTVTDGPIETSLVYLGLKKGLGDEEEQRQAPDRVDFRLVILNLFSFKFLIVSGQTNQSVYRTEIDFHFVRFHIFYFP